MEDKIKSEILKLGADVCGIGTIDRFHDTPEGFAPTDIYPPCKSVISLGIALPKGLFQVKPRLIYGHFNRELCHRVDDIAFTASKWIEKEYGCQCIPIPCDSPNEYWDEKNLTAKGLLSMKHVAVNCGVGEIGKSSLLLNLTYGNRLTLGAILTNLELKADPIEKGICIPNCRKCIDVCPVKAIEDGRVNQKLCRPNTYGKTAGGYDTVDCNLCRNICPKNL